MNSEILFETLGCRLNQIESESAARFFVDAGFSVTMDVPSASDPVLDSVVLCIVNTCTVTQKAEQKARREIRLLLDKCPHAAVIVTGCYAQLAPEELQALGTRVAVLPGQCKDRLADVPLILKILKTEKTFSAQGVASFLRTTLFAKPPEKRGTAEQSFRLATDTFLAHSRSSIKIQDGCDNSCSYCAIHIARGHSVSLPVQEVINRIRVLQKAGQHEVVFTTVNIAQYRGEYNGACLNFSEMLAVLLKETDDISFRISSIYPELVDDRFCEVVSDSRVRPHFHISVQSGSDKILSAMNRNYRASDVVRSVEMLRQAKEDPFLACDIIAGFPGESDDDFERTMDLCRTCGFAYVHVFPFSVRPGTAAALLKPKVPQSVARSRVKKLTDFAVQNKIAYINSYRNRTVRAVAETAKHPLLYAAGVTGVNVVTENFLHCTAKCCGKNVPVPGDEVNVRIIRPLEESVRSGAEIDAEAEIV
ncbi:MAG: tRNA (N(6)-L-threonylcarbamoyladenosine(37)-C(2))-methylthiotransferase MtaB [Treponema sp.]|nr:tRNA (N(6)-L-threonylcarbamoyladenosine(37)-C(2))-methylthiotransferase MtaB [Treponema sp.]